MFSDAGHPVLLTARREDRLKALELPNAICRRHDVLDAEGYSAVIKEAESVHGPVDLLINNAGFMSLEHSTRQQPDDWRRQFDVNCVGLLNTANAVFPSMIERGAGTIINVGSTAGRNIYDNHTAYCGTKHAVHALTEGLRREAAPHGVRVILVSPGMVSTELLANTTSESVLGGYSAYRDDIGGGLQPEAIAEAMLYAYQQPADRCIWEMVVAPTRQLA
jgi:NADP-dependent 3-hydroxy acid dehydrogenase YdfG